MAGNPQKVTLHLSPGTKVFDEGCRLKLVPSEGLRVQAEGLDEDNTISLPAVQPQADQEFELDIFAELSPNSDDRLEKKVIFNWTIV